MSVVTPSPGSDPVPSNVIHSEIELRRKNQLFSEFLIPSHNLVTCLLSRISLFIDAATHATEVLGMG